MSIRESLLTSPRYVALKALALSCGVGSSLGCLEPEALLVGRALRRGDTVIDVGANLGVYTSYFAKLVGDGGRVYAIEPLPKNASSIRNVSKRLNQRHVIVIEGAISNSDENQSAFSVPIAADGRVIRTEASLIIDDGEIGPESRYAQTSLINVRTYSLDSLDIQGRVALIKIDVEGAELLALQGAQMTLQKHRPLIMCETEERWTVRYGYSTSRVFDFFSDCSYDAYIPVVAASTLSLLPCTKVVDWASNYVFIPRERPEERVLRLNVHSGLIVK